MTETEWMTATDPDQLLKHIRGRAGNRRFHLLAVACCRRIWHRLPDPRSRSAVEIAEQFIEGEVSAADLDIARQNAEAAHRERIAGRFLQQGEGAAWVTALAPAWKPDRWPCVGSVVSDAAMAAGFSAMLRGTNKKTRKAAYVRGCLEEHSIQATLIRDIFGNPFRTVVFDPRWRSTDVLGLARGIYDERAFDRLPLLADALMDAGCGDEQIIGHCRSDDPHVRGCWVVDLVLGKG